jgi:hypothetical protein
LYISSSIIGSERVNYNTQKRGIAFCGPVLYNEENAVKEGNFFGKTED